MKRFRDAVFSWSLFSDFFFFINRYPLLLRRLRRRGKGFVSPDDIQVFLRGRPLRRCQGWSQDKPQGLLHQWAGEDHPSIHPRAGQEGVHWSVWVLRDGLGNDFRIWRQGGKGVPDVGFWWRSERREEGTSVCEWKRNLHKHKGIMSFLYRHY